MYIRLKHGCLLDQCFHICILLKYTSNTAVHTSIMCTVITRTIATLSQRILSIYGYLKKFQSLITWASKAIENNLQ